MKRIILKILIRRIFKKHRNTLAIKSDLSNPKMEFHAMADAVLWEDEGLIECHPDLENVFRYIIYYRTSLITGQTNTGTGDKQYFELAKKYFPKWIGFELSRCSYNAEHSDRIKRIRKVSKWRVEKLMKEATEDVE
jgi:hypothetical protein